MKTFLSMLVVVTLGGCYASVGRNERSSREERRGDAAFTLSLPDVLPPLIVVVTRRQRRPRYGRRGLLLGRLRLGPARWDVVPHTRPPHGLEPSRGPRRPRYDCAVSARPLPALPRVGAKAGTPVSALVLSGILGSGLSPRASGHLCTQVLAIHPKGGRERRQG